MIWEFNKKRLTGEYIAGFVQADGSFSAVLTSKTRDTKQYFNISLVFTIVQNEKYKDLILEIQNKFGGIGHWYLGKKDKTIRYQVTKQSDILNVIIPFFMKYQLRSGKAISFLYFKYITEVMATKAHWNNKKILLSLIILASQMNPLGKLGNKIRHLMPDEQKCVINNVQPEGIDISKLTESIQSFKQNKLTLDFIHGLFDGDGGLSVSLVNFRAAVASSSPLDSDNNIISVRPKFTIVQDLHNISLLDEIKSYFNNTGFIHKLSNNCSIFNAGSKSDLISVIFPKMAGKETKDLLSKYYIHELNLPLVKYNKIYYASKILELDSLGIKNEQVLDDVIRLLYNIINNTEGLTLEQYKKGVMRKLTKSNIIEDIV
jgi:LAGLIDADG endonuclease